MLVLGRFEKEVICIGEDIRVEVCNVHSNGKVRLGITAPKEITVDRLEVRESKNKEKAAVQ